MYRTIKLIIAATMLLGAIFSSLSCVRPVWGLSAHTLKSAQGQKYDVVWVVRDQEAIYRCTSHQNRPYCVKAQFR